MSKKEFMDLLAAALSELDDAQQKEIINEFEAHFLLAAQDGKPEDAVSRMLGDPVKIASQYYLYEADTAVLPAADPPCAASDINLQESFATEGLSRIHIEVKNAQVQICGGETEQAVISVCGRTVGSRFVLYREGDCVSLREEQSGFIRFLTRQDHAVTVLLRLPEKNVPDLRIVNNGGDTVGMHIAGGVLSVTNAAGRVAIRQSTLRKMEIRTAAGEVHVCECSAGQYDIMSESSAVTVTRSTGDLTIRAPEGKMHVLDYSGRLQMIASGAKSPTAIARNETTCTAHSDYACLTAENFAGFGEEVFRRADKTPDSPPVDTVSPPETAFPS